MTTLVLDHFDYIMPYTIGERASQVEEPEKWRKWFASVLRRSPILCRRLIAEADLYGRELVGLGPPVAGRVGSETSRIEIRTLPAVQLTCAGSRTGLLKEQIR